MLKKLEQLPKVVLVVVTFAMIAVVGTVDYLTGFELSFSIFYLLAILGAVWFIGKGFATLVSFLSTAASLIGDVSAGAKPDQFTPYWNAVIVLMFYLIVVWLVASIKQFQEDLEQRIKERTAELVNEMAERQRLEKELWQIGEKERQRIGRDLHDNLCQHLTGTALAAQVLGDRLSEASPTLAKDALRIVDLLEGAVDLTRNLARGLYPLSMEAEGLMTALKDLADSTTKHYGVRCVFKCDSAVLIRDSEAATHLYYIAQEAVNNVVRHSTATKCMIRLADRNNNLILNVRDNGIGFSDATQRMNRGLGIRIMAHRATLIGARFKIRASTKGGTVVSCVLKRVIKLTDHPSLNASGL